ncbi:MAG TPA: c(7)-type cytochrome triheme domain-containing protein [Methylomirabilota bacterium]|nr:c(7)-type cytochrome triheme domain-containing protein [Methylomirabilota bacterium]
MRTTGSVSLAVFAVLITGLLIALPGVAQVKPPADFSFEQGKDSPGKVTFSHEKHKEKVEKCTACHVKIFKMKKGTSGPISMDKMKAGEQCGSCHNGKTEMGGKVVFAATDQANCEKCHKK